MFQAQYLFKGNAVYSPWMPRQADNITFSAEVVARTSGSSLTVALYEKNKEDTGDGSPVASASFTISSETSDSYTASGVKEMIRYKYSAAGTGASDYVLFRSLDPVWADNVEFTS